MADGRRILEPWAERILTDFVRALIAAMQQFRLIVRPFGRFRSHQAWEEPRFLASSCLGCLDYAAWALGTIGETARVFHAAGAGRAECLAGPLEGEAPMYRSVARKQARMREDLEAGTPAKKRAEEALKLGAEAFTYAEEALSLGAEAFTYAAEALSLGDAPKWCGDAALKYEPGQIEVWRCTKMVCPGSIQVWLGRIQA